MNVYESQDDDANDGTGPVTNGRNAPLGGGILQQPEVEQQEQEEESSDEEKGQDTAGPLT